VGTIQNVPSRVSPPGVTLHWDPFRRFPPYPLEMVPFRGSTLGAPSSSPSRRSNQGIPLQGPPYRASPPGYPYQGVSSGVRFRGSFQGYRTGFPHGGPLLLSDPGRPLKEFPSMVSALRNSRQVVPFRRYNPGI
jgi:hypothetical protein